MKSDNVGETHFRRVWHACQSDGELVAEVSVNPVSFIVEAVDQNKPRASNPVQNTVEVVADRIDPVPASCVWINCYVVQNCIHQQLRSEASCHRDYVLLERDELLLPKAIWPGIKLQAIVAGNSVLQTYLINCYREVLGSCPLDNQTTVDQKVSRSFLEICLVAIHKMQISCSPSLVPL